MYLARRGAGHAPAGSRSRGQSLVEFALVFPILILLIGAIVQFGVIFWGQNTLTQVARDTGRWAATQNGCTAGTVDVLGTAKALADQSSLIGSHSGWTSPANVDATWTTTESPAPACPPVDNTHLWYVRITIHHQVPIFFPWIPGNGNLTTIAQFRMEPHP